jgi:hypothetical protein
MAGVEVDVWDNLQVDETPESEFELTVDSDLSETA